MAQRPNQPATPGLRPKPIPVPANGPGVLPTNMLPGDGRLPLRTGEVSMTEYTKEQLRKLGWKDGDPVPGDLGVEIQRAAAVAAQDRDSFKWEENKPAGYKPVSPKMVNIDDLPASEQERLTKHIAEYKVEVEAQDAFNAQQAAREASIPDTVDPSVRAASLQAMAAQDAARAGRPTSAVVDDRRPPAGMKIPEGKTFAGVIGNTSVADKISALNSAQQMPEPVAAEPATPDDEYESHSGLHSGTMICPRCLWNTNEPFEIKPTDRDKQVFIAAVLGCTRFEKQYDLLGGKLKVFFRSLLATEVASLNSQLNWHARRGDITGDGEYVLWLMEYRLVMSLSKLVSGDNASRSVLSLAEFEATYPNTFEKVPTARDSLGLPVKAPTGLMAMHEWFYKDIVNVEFMRKIIAQTHRSFQRLVEGMESMAENEDFWQGIE